MRIILSFETFKQEWYCKLMSNDSSKLRSYRKSKNTYGKENYLIRNIPGKYKSFFFKFRCDIVPIIIETGRYEKLYIEERACFICCISVCVIGMSFICRYYQMICLPVPVVFMTI